MPKRKQLREVLGGTKEKLWYPPRVMIKFHRVFRSKGSESEADDKKTKMAMAKTQRQKWRLFVLFQIQEALFSRKRYHEKFAADKLCGLPREKATMKSSSVGAKTLFISNGDIMEFN